MSTEILCDRRVACSPSGGILSIEEHGMRQIAAVVNRGSVIDEQSDTTQVLPSGGFLQRRTAGDGVVAVRVGTELE